MRRVRTLPGGLDRIGPFHPYAVFGAVLLLDLLGAAAIVLGLVWLTDKAEDRIAPGGEEWIQL